MLTSLSNYLFRTGIVVQFLFAFPFANVVLFSFNLYGLNATDYAVLASAEAKTNPPSIIIKWNADSRATNYIIYRKAPEEKRWTILTNLPPDTVSFTDTSVVKGNFYEYKLVREGIENNQNFRGISYILSGIEVYPVEYRGGLLLLVDSSLAENLQNEIQRLELDLVGDGWEVIRYDVSRSASPLEVKTVITNIYYNSKTQLVAIFLLGRIPIPYSGMIAPDGHSDHLGAWPCDVYYADIDGNWTDISVNYTNAANSRLTNIPGDGKFDQNQLPSDTELWIGRVDLSSMPSFNLDEIELVRKYLWKNHHFRFNIFRFQRRGVIDDNFGEFGGEAFSASAWRDFSAFFGRANVIASDYFTSLTTGAYLWSYGCGAGSYTSASGVGTTDQFASSTVYTAFTMLFGSYHGDWDTQNNFMRAALCYPSRALTCGWSGRPHWHCHHMAMGFPVGYSAWITQNNTQSLYEDSSYYKRNIHIALMGDPTLRMHVVSPPSNLQTFALSDGSVHLTWSPSSDAVSGYIVYGSGELKSRYTRLHHGFITDTNFFVSSNTWNFFMVRAVKLETSASGSYYNLSQGVFQSAPVLPPLEIKIEINEPSPGDVLIAGGRLKIAADIFDPSRSMAKLIFYGNGLKLGEARAAPYEITWQNVPPGFYRLCAEAETHGTNIIHSSQVCVHIYQLFIEKMSIWKYLDDGSDAGIAWRMPEFDDSSWKSGQAELGYSNAPVTIVSFGNDPNNKHITTYFRKIFVVNNIEGITNLILGIKRDDGAVIYINGIEVCRENMPTGTITHTTPATSAVSGNDESKFFIRNISPNCLQNGTNVIAVEVHQNSPASSDLSFDLYLYGESKTPEFKLSISNSENNVIKISYPNLSPLIKVQTEQMLPFHEWHTVNPYTFQTNGYNFFNISPGADLQFFRLISE